MADKTVTARLRLVYNEFTKGTDAAAKGLRGIGDQASKTAKGVGRDWGAIGKSVSGLGDSLSTRVSLPLIGLGALATKAAGDFDAAFVSMQTLAGVSGDAVAGMKDEILQLAGETGKAPQELADAMYFLASSGLEGAAAMDALTVSAKASAAGLGPTEVIADAVSSAMLGYAESGLEAAEATDVLIATARAGKAEPAELAGQMGRLIPIAAELGISFADVGGAIATLSTKGNSASDATTQLVNVMGKLLKPSQQATEQLEAVGLSTERIQDLIAEKGLLGTLEVLRDRLGDSGLNRFMEDQQAVIGTMGILGGDLEETRDIFDQVNDSVGATDSAFQTWAESMGAKNAKAFAQFQIALIKLGEVIAPIAADLMSFAADVIGFAKLPDPVQKFVIALAGIAAAVGPLMSVGGRLISVWASVMKIFENWTSAGGRGFADAMNAGTEATNNLGTSMGRLRSGAVNALIGVSALYAIGEAVDAIDPVATANISKLENSLIDFGRSGQIGGEAADALGEDLDKLVDAMHRVAEPSTAERIGDISDHIVPGIENSQHALKEARQTIDDFDEALAKLAARDPEAAAAAFERVTDALAEQGIPAATTKELLDQYSTALAEADTANETAAGGAEGATEALADQEQQVNEAAEAFKNYAATIQATFDPVFGLLNALRQNQDAQRGVVEAQTALDEAIKEHGRNSAEAAEATIALQEAMIGVGDSALGVTTAAADLNAAVAENPALVDSALASLQTWRDQGIIPTDEQLRFLQDQIRRTALEGAALGEVDPQVDVTETGTRNARTQLRSVRDAAHDIPSRRNTSVNASGTTHAKGLVDQFRAALDRLHDRTVHVNVVLNDPSGVKSAALSGKRARGGPVHANRLYEVAENNKHEMFESQGHRYLLPGAEGNVIPMGQMTSAADFAGGGGATVVNLDMRGAVVASERQFRDMVKRAFNTGNRKGRGFNAA